MRVYTLEMGCYDSRHLVGVYATLAAAAQAASDDPTPPHLATVAWNGTPRPAHRPSVLGQRRGLGRRTQPVRASAG